MTLEPIGAVVLLVGSLCFFFGRSISIYAMILSTLLGSSAAAFLPALNYANIQPAHLLLVFVASSVLLQPNAFKVTVESIDFPRAGFWLLVTLLYGTLATIFMPRLFAGATYVFNIAQSGSGGAGIVQVPLGPVSANVTQLLYFAGDVVCFLVFYTFARSGGLSTIARAMIVCAFVNIGFAVVDVAGHVTQTELLSFLRNSGYRMLDDVELAGFKRIVGSFTEASSFAYAALAHFSFSLVLWIRGVYPLLSATAAAFSLVAILFATSTTGYFGLAAFLLIIYAVYLGQLLTRRASRNACLFLVFAPLVSCVIVLLIRMEPQALNTVRELVDVTIFSKLDSGSGIERASWNAQAVQALRDTAGLGAGIGSVRASSWVIAVLSSIGIFGAAVYGLFVACIFLGHYFRRRDLAADKIQSAARAACLVQIIASSVAGSFIDLGLLFFALAGAACAVPYEAAPTLAAPHTGLLIPREATYSLPYETKTPGI